MNLIKTSKLTALNLAKKLLRQSNDVKYLKNKNTKNTSTQCDCGETQAITLAATCNGKYDSVTVGYCKHCGE